MRYELFVSLRYLMGRRREKFISIISLISILGIALGVCALIVVIAVMSGFDRDLRDKIIGANSHIVLEHWGGISNPASVIERLAEIKEIEAAAPFVNGQAMLKFRDMATGVVVRGVDPEGEVKVTRLAGYIVEGDLELGRDEIIIGKELAKKLGVSLHDTVTLISPVDGLAQNFKVSGIFSSGMYEFDLNLSFIDIKTAGEIYGMANYVSGIGVKVNDIYKTGAAKLAISKNLGAGYNVTTWQERNASFFAALKLEKTTMFIILALIVLVAAFNIASTLIMIVMEKTKDIGILKAIGATRRGIVAIFALDGLLIGSLGTLFGALLGFGLCALLAKYQFIKLPRDIYYIDRMPVDVQFGDSLAIIFAALALSLLAAFYPARQAARLDPVSALRYE